MTAKLLLTRKCWKISLIYLISSCSKLGNEREKRGACLMMIIFGKVFFPEFAEYKVANWRRALRAVGEEELTTEGRAGYLELRSWIWEWKRLKKGSNKPLRDWECLSNSRFFDGLFRKRGCWGVEKGIEGRGRDKSCPLQSDNAENDGEWNWRQQK